MSDVGVLIIGQEKSGTSIHLDDYVGSESEIVSITIEPNVQVSVRGGASCAALDFYCGAGSQVEYLYDLTTSDTRTIILRWHLDAHSQGICVVGAVVCGTSISMRYEVNLNGENAYAALRGAFVISSGARLQLATRQQHRACNATSMVTLHGIIGQNSSLDYQSMVDVESYAEHTQASQVLKNMLISDSAYVKATPMLQVRTNNVKCTHGAAMATLDPLSVNYLQARGIRYKQARQMLLQGFLLDAYQGFQPHDSNQWQYMTDSLSKKSASLF